MKTEATKNETTGSPVSNESEAWRCSQAESNEIRQASAHEASSDLVGNSSADIIVPHFLPAPAASSAKKSNSGLNFECYYDGTAGRYWRKNPTGKFVSVTEGALRLFLRSLGMSTETNKGRNLSDVDRAI